MEKLKQLEEQITKLLNRIDQLESRVSELEAENAALKIENAALKAENKLLKAENAELKAKLGRSSRNSNKPPSSDGPGKGAPKNSREPSGRQSGGQPGHEGRTKLMNLTPDKIVKLKPKTECECGGNIKTLTERYTARQVEDIVPAQVVTVEYRAHDGVCETCGKVHKAGFPAGVDSPVTVGGNARAIAAYLTNYQLIPLKRTAELLDDLFGMKISEGTIVRAGAEAYELLADTEKAVKREIISEDVAHFDETGMRVNGKTHWLHSAGTSSATVYKIHSKRGHEGIDAMGILPQFTGTAVHDHWKSYYKYACSHAECNAHILRALKYVHEDLHMSWAHDMICLLGRIKKHVELSVLYGADRLEQADIDAYEARYEAILESAPMDDETPSESLRLAKRLKDFKDETLLFMLDFSVPFTNNLAERDVRMPKAKQKISGCFRSEDGAKHFARIRGVISTIKKKGKNVMDGLAAAFGGNGETFLYSEPR
jgi:transposase/regulator of replication initiation timing